MIVARDYLYFIFIAHTHTHSYIHSKYCAAHEYIQCYLPPVTTNYLNRCARAKTRFAISFLDYDEVINFFTSFFNSRSVGLVLA